MSYREALGKSFWNTNKRRGWRRWAKRQMSKLRRRLAKKIEGDMPPQHKFYKGYEW